MLLCAYVFNLLLIGGGTPTKGKTQIASQALALDRNDDRRIIRLCDTTS
jgi:hypothetical protein